MGVSAGGCSPLAGVSAQEGLLTPHYSQYPEKSVGKSFSGATLWVFGILTTPRRAAPAAARGEPECAAREERGQGPAGRYGPDPGAARAHLHEGKLLQPLHDDGQDN